MPAAVRWVDPQITVRNVARSADWYRRMLGLKVEVAMPDAKNPAFVRLTNGDVAFMISNGADPFSGRQPPKATVEAVAARKAQRVVMFYFRVDDGIESLFRSVRRKGAKVVQELVDQPYGTREFAIRDPDGYEVRVGQDPGRDRLSARASVRAGAPSQAWSSQAGPPHAGPSQA